MCRYLLTLWKHLGSKWKASSVFSGQNSSFFLHKDFSNCTSSNTGDWMCLVFLYLNLYLLGWLMRKHHRIPIGLQWKLALITAQQCSSALWKHPCLAVFAYITGRKLCICELFEDELISYFEDTSEYPDHGETLQSVSLCF